MMWGLDLTVWHGQGTEIIAYCRGSFCAYTDEAVAMLNKAGYRATRLEEGFSDWQIQELPYYSIIFISTLRFRALLSTEELSFNGSVIPLPSVAMR